MFGKVIHGVTRTAAAKGVPVIALAGSLGDGWRRVLDAGVAACYSIADGPIALSDAINRAPELIADTAEQIARTLKATGASGPLSLSGRGSG